MDDHQTGNARALADVGAALIIDEGSFTPQRLTACLEEKLSAKGEMESMAAAARGRVRDNAAARLADLVETRLLKSSARQAA